MKKLFTSTLLLLFLSLTLISCKKETVEPSAFVEPQKETVIVPAEQATDPYTLTWTAERAAKYGSFGTFEVWMDSGVEGVILVHGQINMTTNAAGTAASEYQFHLAGVKTIIVIK